MALKQFSTFSFRPEGYEYPLGLSGEVVWNNTAGANAATNTTGGTQTVVDSNAIHTFTTSGTFTPGFDLSDVEYLVVGGGGGGGETIGGGGGAGEVKYGTISVPSTDTVAVTIGSGSNGGWSASLGVYPSGTNGQASTIVRNPAGTTISSALGGGAGGGYNGPEPGTAPGGGGHGTPC